MDSYEKKIAAKVKKLLSDAEPAHRFDHALRVYNLVLTLSKKEGADQSVLGPAALLHDVVIFRKDQPKSRYATFISSQMARRVLEEIGYPEEKIDKIVGCIQEHSFSGGLKPSSKESRILYDADKLEAVGAVSIARTFASTGHMGREFYNPKDPFCKEREPDPSKYALDLFYSRLLKVQNKLHTKTAKDICRKRTLFLKKFLDQFRDELEGK